MRLHFSKHPKHFLEQQEHIACASPRNNGDTIRVFRIDYLPVRPTFKSFALGEHSDTSQHSSAGIRQLAFVVRHVLNDDISCPLFITARYFGLPKHSRIRKPSAFAR